VVRQAVSVIRASAAAGAAAGVPYPPRAGRVGTG